MTEVNAQQRQNAKAAAANAAVSANDTAVVLGGAGLIVAAGGVVLGAAPLGVGVGLVLGLGSFAAWAIGNRYQRLANDPPRDDFDQVTVSGAQLVDTEIPATEPDATFIRYAANQLILIDAMAALVTSLERFDGAVAAGDTDKANMQAAAVQRNASRVVTAHNTLMGLTAPINETWSAATVDASTVTFEQAGDFLATAVSPDSVGLGSVLPCVTGLVDQNPFADLNPHDHPLIARGELPPTPAELISSNLNDVMTTLSDPLSSLVDTPSA
jgi:hypothetical protein